MPDRVPDPELTLSGAQSLPERIWHTLFLVGAIAIIAAACVLQVRPDQRVQWNASFVLPETCGARATWDVDCPACGLTRSFIHLADGDPMRSLQANRVGWLVALAIAFQIPLRTAALTGRARWLQPFLDHQSLTWLGIAAVLIASWTYTIAVHAAW